MRRIILMAFVVVTLGLVPTTGHACWCLMPEVPEAFGRAEAVFIGEVAEIIPPRTDDAKAPLPDRLYRVRFKVEKVFKGIPSAEIELLSNQLGRGNCLAWQQGPFFKGEKYLVYTDPYPADESLSMAVLACDNRSAILSTAPAEVKQLQRMPATFNYSFQPVPLVKSPKETFVDSWLKDFYRGVRREGNPIY